MLALAVKERVVVVERERSLEESKTEDGPTVVCGGDVREEEEESSSSFYLSFSFP